MYWNSEQRQYQAASLLHTLGEDALKVYNGFHFTILDEQRTREEILEAFDTYAVGETNVTYERLVFQT